MAKFTTERRERLLTLLETGRTVEDAAAVVGINPSTVHRWAARGRAGAVPQAEFAQRFDAIRQGDGERLSEDDVIRALEQSIRKGSVTAMKAMLAASSASGRARRPSRLTSSTSSRNGGAVSGDERALLGEGPRTVGRLVVLDEFVDVHPMVLAPRIDNAEEGHAFERIRDERFDLLNRLLHLDRLAGAKNDYGVRCVVGHDLTLTPRWPFHPNPCEHAPRSRLCEPQSWLLRDDPR